MGHLDDQQDAGNQGTKRPDASETILSQQRGDRTETREGTSETGQTGQTSTIVDLAHPDANAAALQTRTGGDTTKGLNGATVKNGEIVFNAPGAPDTEGERRTDTAAGAQAKVERGVTPETAFNTEYNAVATTEGGEQKVKLSPEAEQAIKDQMTEFQKKLEGSNYTLSFEKTEGPWNAIDRMQKDAAAKQKAGKELTTQEQAILGLKPDDVMAEARRIRDRDFQVFKTADGKPRNWYKVHENTNRYSEQEMKDIMAKQEKNLRDAAETQAKEAEARAREAALEQQRQLAAAIEKNVPSEDIVKQAATTTGVQGDPHEIREKMKAHVVSEVEAGTLKSEDLNKPYPRVGAAYVATGALTADELKAALTKQTELGAAAPDHKAPRLDAVLKDIYKDNPEKLAQLDKSSKFYDEMKRLADAAAQPKAQTAGTEQVTTDPFNSRYSELPQPVPAVVPERVDGQPAATVDDTNGGAQARRDVLKEVTEQPKGGDEVARDVKQAPSGYLALRAFQAGHLDDRNWSANNEAQKAIVDALKDPKLKEELPKLSTDVIDGVASVGDVGPIKTFLESHNITDITLNPIGKNDIAFASTLNVKGQWAGQATEMEVGGKKFPAVSLKQAESYTVGDQTVVKLYSGPDGMEVYATPMPQDISGEEALRQATALTPKTNTPRAQFSGATIPMVKMNAQTTLSDLVGMKSDKGETITQAEMQTKLNLDEHGFSVDQGLALTASRGLDMTPPFSFDKPFLLWVKTKDGSQPLTAVRVDERFWRDPKQAK